MLIRQSDKRRVLRINISILCIQGLVVLLLLAVGLRIGFRDITIGIDYARYYTHYTTTLRQGVLPADDFEVGYRILVLIGAYLRLPPEHFFSLIAFLNLTLHLWVFTKLARNVLENGVQRLLVVVTSIAVLLAWPFYWNGTLNIIRQGLAVPFLLSYLGYLLNRQFGRALLMLALATTVHTSSLIIGLIAVIILLPRRIILTIVGALTVLYLLQVPDKLMMLVERITRIPVYTTIMEYGSRATYRTGYRYDFLIFSLIPLVFWGIGQILFRWRMPLSCVDLVALYSVLLIPFLLVGYGAYMDRWLFPAWILMPFVLCAVSFNIVKPSFYGQSLVLVTSILWIVIASLLFPQPLLH